MPPPVLAAGWRTGRVQRGVHPTLPHNCEAKQLGMAATVLSEAKCNS